VVRCGHRRQPCAKLLRALVTAQALDVDWKLYGWASVVGDSACFYDARGVVRRSDGHLRVWTKCLLLKDTDSIVSDIKKDPGRTILENSAQKVARHYVPPITLIDDDKRIDNIDITVYEETANIGNIEPVAQIFYEINCSEGMLRELSISLRNKDGRGSHTSPKPLSWTYIAPETNVAILQKILCPARE